MTSKPRPATLPIPTSWTPPLLLTVRFSTSLPDLHLDIPSPSQTTVAALKHLIRSRLEEPNSQRRLRFIHQGKILPDNAALSSVLRPLPPPPASPSAQHDPRGKGKAVEGQAEPPARIYVNCSIGDSLTDEELKAEALAALEPPTAGSTKGARQGVLGVGGLGTGEGGTGSTNAQRPTPRGFDRLLNAGFTAAEVNQLRLQFRSIQAIRHTPDTMPSPDTLRSMEDAWIDNNGGGAVPGGGGDGSGDNGDDGFGVANGVLDVLLQGMIIGFFWPLGSMSWLIRESGLWSKRWQVCVSFGLILSIAIGIIKAMSGEN
jgi:hypothetical protein